MTTVFKVLPSRERAKKYRQLEQEAQRAAATVPPLYRESFKRMALKWRRLAEEAERGFRKTNTISLLRPCVPTGGAY